MILTIEYKKVLVTVPWQTEPTKSHRIIIRTQDKRKFMSSAFNFEEALAGAISIVQTEFVDPANAES